MTAVEVAALQSRCLRAERALRDLQRQHERTLEQWTRERGELRDRIRSLTRRERKLAGVLIDYLAGDLDADTARAKAGVT